MKQEPALPRAAFTPLGFPEGPFVTWLWTHPPTSLPNSPCYVPIPVLTVPDASADHNSLTCSSCFPKLGGQVHWRTRVQSGGPVSIKCLLSAPGQASYFLGVSPAQQELKTPFSHRPREPRDLKDRTVSVSTGLSLLKFTYSEKVSDTTSNHLLHPSTSSPFLPGTGLHLDPPGFSVYVCGVQSTFTLLFMTCVLGCERRSA